MIGEYKMYDDIPVITPILASNVISVKCPICQTTYMINSDQLKVMLLYHHWLQCKCHKTNLHVNNDGQLEFMRTTSSENY